MLHARRQAAAESNLQDTSSKIPCFSATGSLGSNRNIWAHASVHGMSVPADSTQEGETVQEAELVHHVQTRRNIMGSVSAQEAEQGIMFSCCIFNRLQEFYYWGVTTLYVTTKTIGKIKAEEQHHCCFGHSNEEGL